MCVPILWVETLQLKGYRDTAISCGPIRAGSCSLHCWEEGWQHTPLCSGVWEIAALRRMTKKTWTVRSEEEANPAQTNEELPLQSYCWNICNPHMDQPLNVTALLGWGKEWKFHLVQLHSFFNCVLLWKRIFKTQYSLHNFLLDSLKYIGISNTQLNITRKRNKKSLEKNPSIKPVATTQWSSSSLKKT